jgi:preprotein translocase subunit SecF
VLNIVGKRGWYFLISALIILPGLISMIIPPGWSTLKSGLNPGIDFTSGTVMDVTFGGPVSQTQIQERMNALGHPEALIQSTGSQSALIRTKVLAEDAGGGVSERQRVQDDLEANVAPIETLAFDSISPIIAQETLRNTFLALLAATVFILLYIWYAFRRAPKAYRYGISAVVALAHDTLIVLGVFSILGRAFNVEVNATFIIGILTVVGYSVNDTIVVFDRIRENLIRHPERALESQVNLSIIETIGRSFNSSFTTLLVLLAMLLIGGPSIRGLLLVVTLGVIVGTYSSIFIAAQFLVIWDRREFGRAFRWWRSAPAAGASLIAGLVTLIGR